MKKSNRGFFLAETIVMIALVTTVMAFVYPNLSKLYGNYMDKVKYYDQPEDLYVLATQDKKITAIDSVSSRYIGNLKSNYDLIALYLIPYNERVSSNASGETFEKEFNRYLKRTKITTTNDKLYRLVGVFKKDGVIRFASIKSSYKNEEL